MARFRKKPLIVKKSARDTSSNSSAQDSSSPSVCASSEEDRSYSSQDEDCVWKKCVGMKNVRGEYSVKHYVSNFDTFACSYCEREIGSTQLSDHFKVRCKKNPFIDQEFARVKKARDNKRMKEFSMKKKEEEALKSINKMLSRPSKTVFKFFHYTFFLVSRSNPFHVSDAEMSAEINAEVNYMYKQKLIVRLVHNLLVFALKRIGLNRKDGFGTFACKKLMNLFKTLMTEKVYKYSWRTVFGAQIDLSQELLHDVRLPLIIKFFIICSIFLNFVSSANIFLIINSLRK